MYVNMSIFIKNKLKMKDGSYWNKSLTADVTENL